jgi:hypothetical protein
MRAPKIVTGIPLIGLWDEEGEVIASRERYLSPDQVKELLRLYPVEFIVADVGLPLKRIAVHKCYEFWKSEAQRRLVVNPEGCFDLDAFPGHYAYVASEWSGKIQTPIILLEMYH